MKLPFFQLDSFTKAPFAGNPAAVVVSEQVLEREPRANIAAENNLSETAFISPQGEDYAISWFTPKVEVPLCGHGTLASAAVVMQRLEPQRECVVFHSLSGPLTVRRSGVAFTMDFPARFASPSSNVESIAGSLGARPTELFENEFNYLAVFEKPQVVRDLTPDMALAAALGRPGLIVTAPGNDAFDTVSRYFAPAKGIPEDPVTGGAHCTLTPYWCNRLGKNKLHAYQASRRGGEMQCELMGNRVLLTGECVFVIEGHLDV